MRLGTLIVNLLLLSLIQLSGKSTYSVHCPGAEGGKLSTYLVSVCNDRNKFAVVLKPSYMILSSTGIPFRGNCT